MKVSKRQLRRIIKEEKSKLRGSKKISYRGLRRMIREIALPEASLSVDMFDFDEYKNTGGPEAVRKMNLKIKVSPGKAKAGSGDFALFTGQEKDLVAYAQNYLGADGRTLKDVQEEMDQPYSHFHWSS